MYLQREYEKALADYNAAIDAAKLSGDGCAPAHHGRGNTLYLLNRHKEAFDSYDVALGDGLTLFNLSYMALTYNSPLFSSALFSHRRSYQSLTDLNLSGNRLGDAGVEGITKLIAPKNHVISVFPSLRILSLADNGMTRVGFMSLANAMTETSRLETLDISKNFIYVANPALEKHSAKMRRNPRLRSVFLSGNALPPDVDEHLNASQEVFHVQLPERKEESQTVSVVGSFFYSRPVILDSVIAPGKQITQDAWIVAIECKQGILKQHAMIFLEKMRAKGQRQIRKFHILTDGLRLMGVAQIKSNDEPVGEMFLEREKYNFSSHKIIPSQGETLEDLVNEWEKTGVPFGIFFNSTSSGRVNCTRWCRNALKKIGINDISESDIPGVAATGGWCTIA